MTYHSSIDYILRYRWGITWERARDVLAGEVEDEHVQYLITLEKEETPCQNKQE